MGVAEGGRYVTSGGAKAGGRIILTKGVAIEGTAIICNDKADLVKEALGESVQRRGAEYIRMISVVREALAAFNFGGVQAMHDPTEGGIAGGLHEMCDASKCGFRIYENKLIVKPETEKICDVLGIDPLRLISSGALMIVVDDDRADGLLGYLRRIGITASVIGDVVDDPRHRKIVKSREGEVNLPRPETDELWRALLEDVHDFDLKKIP